MLKVVSKVFLAAFLISAFSCVTRLTTPAGVPEISVSEYEALIIKKSNKIELYEGLYNKLTIEATWLDSQTTEATLSHSARLSQWPETKYKDEKTKAISRHAENTEFFVSFYTPERKHNDLSQNKTLWKIFLDVNGQRYEGKATKVKLLLTEIQALYAYHNRWSVPYIVSFPVATSLVENKRAVLTFTGAIASPQLVFNSVQ
jgi:hypothetical protein